MKIVAFVWVYLLASSCASQDKNINTDSLKKYSYFANGYYKGAWSGSGSGFFIKKQNRLFFVTNYHVYSGYDAISKHYTPADALSIRVISTTDSLFVTIPVNRDSSIESKINSLNRADLIVLEIDKELYKIPSTIKTFDLTQFVNTSGSKKVPNNIFIYGYPSDRVTYNKSSQFLVPLGEAIYEKYKEADSLTYKKIQRSSLSVINELFTQKYCELNFILLGATSRGGMSGSPVFGEFKKKGKVKYKLIGILRGGTSNMIEIIEVNQLVLQIKQEN